MLKQRRSICYSLCALAILGSAVFPRPCFAQAIDLPGAADPGRVLRGQKAPVLPDVTLEPDSPKKKAVPVAPQGTENLRFVLRNLSFDGMSAYEPSEISPFYSKYLGHEISVAQLFEIMTAVQQKYMDDGYALSKVVIPNQNIEGGNVRFAVIEGRVEDVDIDAHIRPSPIIDDAANQIKAMQPLNVKRLERIMLILNDLPDSNVSAILASPTANSEPGAVRLVLQKNPSTARMGSVSVDDHGSVFTGPLQIKGTANGYHVGPSYSMLSVSSMVAVPIDEQKSLTASYMLPILGVSGTKLRVSASRALTEPGSSLSTLDIKGTSQSMEANLSYPLIRQRDMTLTVDGGLEFKTSRTKILGEELSDDRMSVLRTGVNFNVTDSLAGYSVLDVHYAQGLDLFGVREAGSENLSRENGKHDFKKFEMVTGRIQALPKQFELFGAVNGQYSFDPLLSSEEFGFGGGQTGRGYDPSEITGDRGISLTLELRHNTTMDAFGGSTNIQPYFFYDIGKVWNIDEGAKNKISAASAGLGVRAVLGSDWNLDLNFSKALTKSVDNEQKYENDLGSRVLFSISKSF